MFSDAKDFVDIVSSVVQIGAIFLGGWWTWRLFVRNREDQERAIVTHSVAAYPLSATQQLLHVAFEVANVGNVAIRLDRFSTTVQQIAPMQDEIAKAVSVGKSIIEKGEVEVDWDVIAEYEQSLTDEDWVLEPGEKDTMHLDFMILRSVTIVQVHTMIYCRPEKEAQFWDNQVIMDLAAPSASRGTVPPEVRGRNEIK